ncbi:MAG: hypothetical protein IT460_14595 [Planctomycetes bacterium]|nr:hypothetical protein [Planctomycetota bacterium]
MSGMRRLACAVTFVVLAACGGGGSSGGGAPAPVPPPAPVDAPYASLAAVFAGTASDYFGIGPGRVPKDGAKSHYTVPAPTGDNRDDLTQAWFEVANRDIVVQLDADGRMEYPVVYGPLAGFPQGTDGTPARGPREFLAGSPWTLAVTRHGLPAVRLPEAATATVELLDGSLFRWSYDLGDLRVDLVPVAPEREDGAGANPRAVLALLRLTNASSTDVAGTVSVVPTLRDADLLDATAQPATLYGDVVGPVPWNHGSDRRNYVPRFAEVGPATPGYEAVAAVGTTSFVPGTTDVAFALPPGATQVSSVALLVGGGTAELAHTLGAVRSRAPLAWVNETVRAMDRRRGRLEIYSDPRTAEWVGRALQVGMDSHLRDGNGRLTSPHGGSWMLMARVWPRALAALVPDGDLGIGCPAGDLTWSVTGATLPAVLLGLHYRATGDRAAVASSTCRDQFHCLVDALQAQRWPGTHLVPSTRIWDGPSRGDFHTGSNVSAWFAIRSAARLASEVWAEPAVAGTWAADAALVREEILARCVVAGRYGPQLAEGTFADGRVDADVLCHDGEEIVVASSPQLGFVEVDDVVRTNHGGAATTAQNRFWNAAARGMHWNDSAPVTSPGWLTALSGAAGEGQLRAALDLWRRVTDVDGSVWWWPYDHGETDPDAVLRRASHVGGSTLDTAKCDYASSSAVALLLHDVIGLDADVPATRAWFRPLPPWPSFRWVGGRCGDAFFDVSYVDDGGRVTASVTNRNLVPYRTVAEVTVPSGRRALAGQATGRRFGRDARRVEVDLAPGATATVALDYEAIPSTPCADAAYTAAAAAHDALRTGGFADAATSDLDGDGVVEGHAWRLLAEARCADPAVEAAWQANWTLGASLGWGDAWATICAEYATVSQGMADVVNAWCSPRLPFVPFRRGTAEPLDGRGDYDGDGRSNEAEYEAVGGAEASPRSYATAATRP